MALYSVSRIDILVLSTPTLTELCIESPDNDEEDRYTQPPHQAAIDQIFIILHYHVSGLNGMK